MQFFSKSNSKSKVFPKIQLIIIIFLMLLMSSCGGFGGGGVSKPNNAGTEKTETGFPVGSMMEKIYKRGYLIVGIRWDQKPFSYTNKTTGSEVGFDVEVVKVIATAIFGEKIEGKIRYQEYDPNAKELKLRQNTVDMVLSGYEISAIKKQEIDFAGPYLSTGHQLVVDKKSGIDSMFKLNGRTVCVVNGYSRISDVKEKVTAITIVEKPTINDCLSSLYVGDVSGVISNQIDLAPYRTALGGQVAVLDAGLPVSVYGVGLNQQNDEFRIFINDQLEDEKKMKNFGTWVKNFGLGQVSRPAVDRY